MQRGGPSGDLEVTDTAEERAGGARGVRPRTSRVTGALPSRGWTLPTKVWSPLREIRNYLRSHPPFVLQILKGHHSLVLLLGLFSGPFPPVLVRRPGKGVGPSLITTRGGEGLGAGVVCVVAGSGQKELKGEYR